MRRFYLPLLGLGLGVAVGFLVEFRVPAEYARYLTLAVLALLDAAVGGLRAFLAHSFKERMFYAGLLCNAVLAGLLTLLGDRLGANLYLAVVVVFGIRLFRNTAAVRRLVIK